MNPPAYPRAWVVCLAAGTALSAAANAIVPVALPQMAADLGVRMSAVSWVMTGFSGACALAFGLTEWLARRFGPVRVLVFSLLMFTLASLMCGLVRDLPALLVFRAVQGFFAGPLIPLGQTLLLAAFPASRARHATAIWACAALIAPVAGPLLGGLLTEYLSWRWIFLAGAPIGAALTAGIYRLAPPSPNSGEPDALDHKGIALLLVWTSSLVAILGLSRHGLAISRVTIALLALIGVFSLAGFIRHARGHVRPVLDLRLFDNPRYAKANVGVCVAYAIGTSHTVLFPVWVHQALGYSLRDTGAMMALWGLAAFATATAVGKAGSRLQVLRAASVGMVLSALVLGVRALYSQDAPLALLLASSVAQGVGMALVMIPLSAWGLETLAPQRHPAATGLSSFVRSMSGGLGIAVAILAWERVLSWHHPAGSLPAAAADAAAVAGASAQVFGWSALLLLLITPWILHAPSAQREPPCPNPTPQRTPK